MHIAICGAPGAGKSTVQKILYDEFSVHPVDDGRILRDIAIQSFGLTEEQVTSEQGKNSYIEFLNQKWQIRQILGEIGKSLENIFSEHIIPHLTIQKHCVNEKHNYSFGSVRRSQPQYFNKIGGIVIEVIRKGCTPKYDFDEYTGKIDFTIINNGTLEELKQQINNIFHKISTRGKHEIFS